MQEAHAGHRRHRRLQHRIGHRRGAVGDDPQAGDVVPGQVGEMGDRVDHGRHQQRVGDAMPGDLGQHVGGVEARDEDMRAGNHGDGVGRGAIGQVEHRSGMDVDAVVTVADGRDDHGGVGDQVAMGEHHALRPAGGAAGVEDAGHVVVAGLAERLRHLGEQALVGDHAGRSRRLADMDEGGNRREVLELARQAGEGVVQQKRRGAAVLQDEGDLGWRQPRVERHDDGAQCRQGEHRLEIAVAVQRQDGDAVTLADPETGEAAGDPSDPLDGLRPGAATIAEDRRGAARIDGRCPVEALGDLHRYVPCSLVPGM